MKPTARHWAIRVVKLIVIIECLWLIAINGALRLPLTQELLNDIKPEKFRIAWTRAWSWYPGHVYVQGVLVSGQTPGQQWQAEAENVSARVALLPLMFKRVTVTGGSVENSRYLQRPRLKPDKDYSDAQPFFPDIDGYEVSPAGERNTKPRKPWVVNVKNARIFGQHSVWVQRFQAKLEAEIFGDLESRSQGGPLDLRIASLDLGLQRVWVDTDQNLIEQGSISGSIRLGPYGYREHRGLQMLPFLDLDLDITMDAQQLAFVRLVLVKFPGLDANGSGDASGQLVVERGVVTAGTDFNVKADDLVIIAPPFVIDGSGDVHLQATQDQELPIRLNFIFDALNMVHHDDRSPFLTGSLLELTLDDDGNLVPQYLMDRNGDNDPASPAYTGPVTRSIGDFRATLKIKDATVDSMTTFNRYLPKNSPFGFMGGNANLNTDLVLRPGFADGDLTLNGQDLRARLDDQQLGLDLRVDGRIAGSSQHALGFDLAGSRLTLDRAWVLGEKSDYAEDDWSADAYLSKAILHFEQPLGLDTVADVTISDTAPLAALFRNHGGPGWLTKRLDFADIKGSAQLRLHENTLYVPDAFLNSEDLEVRMKGTIQEPVNNGMIYLRYKKLDTVFKVSDGDKNVDILKARKTFDAYQIELPDESTLTANGSQ